MLGPAGGPVVGPEGRVECRQSEDPAPEAPTQPQVVRAQERRPQMAVRAARETRCHLVTQ